MSKNEGWLSNEAVQQYLKVADVAVPYRKDMLLQIACLRGLLKGKGWSNI